MAVDPTSKIELWTKMIRTSDMAYPVFLRDFLAENKNVSIGSFVWEYGMRESGYFKVHETPQPTGDIVTEKMPVYNEEDELWYQVWEVESFSPEQIEANLNAAKAEKRDLAYQQFSFDLLSGVLIGEDLFAADPDGANNLNLTRAYAVANPDKKDILLRRSDFSLITVTSSEAIGKIDEVFIKAGEVHQKLLKFLESVYATTLITEIPEVPQTFIGE